MPIDRRLLGGVALLCFSNLLLEIALTRIFSAMMFYHFTFLAVALALLGIAAGGVHVYVRRTALLTEPVRPVLSKYARWCCWTTVLALAIALWFPVEFVPATGGVDVAAGTLTRLLLLTTASALPFFFGGTTLSILIARHAESIGALYFADLAGASFAALSVGALLALLGGPGTVLLAAAAAAAASLFLGRPQQLDVATTTAAVVALAVNAFSPLFVVPSVKTVQRGRTVFEKWNIISRITVERLSRGYDIKIDSYASTPLLNVNAIGEVDAHDKFASLVHALFPGGAEEMLIIGPGGGRDVVNALASGAHHVIGVDINPIIVNDIMRGRFLTETGGLYQHPRVSIAVEDGRSYVRRSAERHDSIQASMVDTWAASSSGAFALSDITLYTREAFVDYYSHLTPNGALTMSRWWGRESERLAVLAAEALVDFGVPARAVREHLYFARCRYPDKDETFGTLVATRQPLSAAQLALLDMTAARAGFEVVLRPGAAGGDLARVLDRRERSRLDYDLEPPVDDHPFFFYFSRPFAITSLVSSRQNDPASWVLLASASSLIILAVGFVVLPMLLFGASDLAEAARASPLDAVRSLCYFAALGLGFIIVELSLMHRMTLFLGQPTSSFVVVLASLLTASAAGALLSRRIKAAAPAATRVGIAVAVAVGVTVAGVDPLFRTLAALPFETRMALTCTVALALGFPMGMMLPLGVRIISESANALVPWCWGINGATSVVGTVASTVLALSFGFRVALMAGAFAYAAAAWLAWELNRSSLHRMRAPGAVTTTT